MADAPPPATTAAPPPVDVYRDTPLRFAGYANEVGESFKHMAPRWFYYGSYVVSSLYVAADAKDKYDRDGDVAKGADALVWQAPRPRRACSICASRRQHGSERTMVSTNRLSRAAVVPAAREPLAGLLLRAGSYRRVC